MTDLLSPNTLDDRKARDGEIAALSEIVWRDRWRRERATERQRLAFLLGTHPYDPPSRVD